MESSPLHAGQKAWAHASGRTCQGNVPGPMTFVLEGAVSAKSLVTYVQLTGTNGHRSLLKGTAQESEDFWLGPEIEAGFGR